MSETTLAFSNGGGEVQTDQDEGRGNHEQLRIRPVGYRSSSNIRSELSQQGACG